MAKSRRADAFGSLGIARREALWAARALTPKHELPLFAADLDGEGIVEPAVHLPQMTEGENVVEDYVAIRLTLRSHPVALIRHQLSPGIDPRLLKITKQPVVSGPPSRANVGSQFPAGRIEAWGDGR